MATPTIPNGEEHFFPIIYEGNGAGQRVGKFIPFTDNGTIANSLIFNDGDSPYMRRTPSGAGNRKTFTISFWVKRCQLGVLQIICTQGADHNNATVISFDTSNRFKFSHNDSGSATYTVTSNRTFEDTSKFYHLLASVDTTQSTASDRVKLYVDGDLITSFASSSYPSQDFDLDFNSTGTIAVSGQIPSGTLYPFDGYLTEINLVDGTALTPDTFGLTDTSTGRWIPKALTGITYGTNGFRLQFGSSSALGDDTSGNNNDFSVSNLVAGDQTTDSPTQNHATWNPNPNTGGTLSEGNLKLVTANSGYSVKLATLKPKSGKYYAEFTIGAENGGLLIGVQELATAPSSSSTTFPQGDGSFAWRGSNGYVFNGGSSSVAGSTYTTGDVVALALDLDNQVLKFYKNNSLDNTIGLTGKDVGIAVGDFGNTQYGTVTANFGQKSFTYTPPTGFVALQQDNLPETAKGISGMVWIKNRDETRSHVIYDSSRGAGQKLQPDKTNADTLNVDGVTKFLKGGVAVGSQNQSNDAGDGHVAWNWVANGGTTATNNDGSLTSTVQVNQTAGFSIVQGKYFDGTLGHGLSQTPEWIIYKETSPNTNNWFVWHKDLPSSNYYLTLNSSAAQANYGSTLFAPTSTTFATNLATVTNRDAIAYCWHGVEGFSKFGQYSANNSTDGPFVYLGFKPKFLVIKSSAAISWYVIDATRSPINPVTAGLTVDNSQAEFTNQFTIDFLSNGFKIRNSNSGYGASTNSTSHSPYYYMAFAEHPFVGDGTNPVTAR